MSDELKEMLIAMALKNKEKAEKDNTGNILIAASVNLHDDGLSIFAAPDPATQFLFGSEFVNEQVELLAPVLDQIARNFADAIANKNWKEF